MCKIVYEGYHEYNAFTDQSDRKDKKKMIGFGHPEIEQHELWNRGEYQKTAFSILAYYGIIRRYRSTESGLNHIYTCLMHSWKKRQVQSLQ